MLSAPVLVETILRPAALRLRGDVRPETASGLRTGPLQPSFAEIIGHAPSMQKLRTRLWELASTDTPVLITGEPGTGKHLLAAALHQLAQRGGPLLTVNAVGLPIEDLMLHLYGQERLGRGGAVDITPGLLERAQGGTLVFEEVTQLDAGGQRCLGRLISESTYARRGSAQLRRVDVRVIAMTSQPLLAQVRRGEFAEALFHRLTAAWLDVPPLRQRREDLPRLAAAFLAQDQPPDPRGPIELPTATLLRLLGYGWPGNVRELREVLALAAPQIKVHPTRPARRELGPELIAPLLARTRVPSELRFPIGTPIETVQREVILTTLAAVDGNKKDAAELLGLSRGALYTRLRAYSAQARALWRTAQQRSLETLTDSSRSSSRAAKTRRKSGSPPGSTAVEPIRTPCTRADAQAEDHDHDPAGPEPPAGSDRRAAALPQRLGSARDRP